jgi:hypothetical protein
MTNAYEKATEAIDKLKVALDASIIEVGELDTLYAFSDELQSLVTKLDQMIDKIVSNEVKEE